MFKLKPYYYKKMLEAGCDEAGRGCLAGPVVAAAVILPKDYHHPFLNDSKQLTKKQRDEVREQIIAEAIDWAIAEVSHVEIDRINILNASFLAMHRAIEQLKIKPRLLLIDGNRFNPYQEYAYKCIIKGDCKFFSIAAASVLAKTHRDELMHGLGRSFPHYGWETNVGYPTRFHRRAVAEFGLSPYHRVTFQTCQAIGDG